MEFAATVRLYEAFFFSLVVLSGRAVIRVGSVYAWSQDTECPSTDPQDQVFPTPPPHPPPHKLKGCVYMIHRYDSQGQHKSNTADLLVGYFKGAKILHWIIICIFSLYLGVRGIQRQQDTLQLWGRSSFQYFYLIFCNIRDQQLGKSTPPRLPPPAAYKVIILLAPPSPSLQASVSPFEPKGGHTCLRVRGWGEPIRTTRETLQG